MNGQSTAMELHLTIPQIAALWGHDTGFVRELFREEPGVLRHQNGKREYLRVPLSVAQRVHRRMANGEG